MSAHFPLRLTTGRLRDHWHSMSRTALVPGLTRHQTLPQLAMHPRDMARHGVQAGMLATLRNKRGSAVLRERMVWLAALCQSHGLRLSDRLHIHLYGDTRGT